MDRLEQLRIAMNVKEEELDAILQSLRNNPKVKPEHYEPIEKAIKGWLKLRRLLKGDPLPGEDAQS